MIVPSVIESHEPSSGASAPPERRLAEADREAPLRGAPEQILAGQRIEPRRQRHTAAEIGVQSLREHRPLLGSDAHPIAVECDFEAALGAELRISAPPHVGEQAGRMANALPFVRVGREERRDPAIDMLAMTRETPLRVAFRPRRDEQRIFVAHCIGQRLEQQPFAQTKGGYREMRRLEARNDRAEQMRRIGQHRRARAAQARHRFDTRLVAAIDPALQRKRSGRRHFAMVDDGQRIACQAQCRAVPGRASCRRSCRKAGPVRYRQGRAP